MSVACMSMRFKARQTWLTVLKIRNIPWRTVSFCTETEQVSRTCQQKRHNLPIDRGQDKSFQTLKLGSAVLPSDGLYMFTVTCLFFLLIPTFPD